MKRMTQRKKLRILLADDHRVLRTGLKLLLSSQEDFIVVAEASDGQEVLDVLKGTETDVVLLDLSMPGMGGLECLTRIREAKYPVQVLALTMHSEQQYIREVMLHGANGYLCKDTLDTELFQAIRTVASGRRYLSEQNAHVLLDSLIEEPNDDSELSAREKEVLDLLVHGYSLSVIAEKLYLSVKTVSTYKTRLMLKLGCTQKSELVEYALKHNILG